jgi:hypothetical protein
MTQVVTDLLVRLECSYCRREFEKPLSELMSTYCPHCGKRIDASVIEAAFRKAYAGILSASEISRLVKENVLDDFRRNCRFNK